MPRWISGSRRSTAPSDCDTGSHRHIPRQMHVPKRYFRNCSPPSGKIMRCWVAVSTSFPAVSVPVTCSGPGERLAGSMRRRAPTSASKRKISILPWCRSWARRRYERCARSIAAASTLSARSSTGDPISLCPGGSGRATAGTIGSHGSPHHRMRPAVAALHHIASADQQVLYDKLMKWRQKQPNWTWTAGPWAAVRSGSCNVIRPPFRSTLLAAPRYPSWNSRPFGSGRRSGGRWRDWRRG